MTGHPAHPLPSGETGYRPRREATWGPPGRGACVCVRMCVCGTEPDPPQRLLTWGPCSLSRGSARLLSGATVRCHLAWGGPACQPGDLGRWDPPAARGAAGEARTLGGQGGAHRRSWREGTPPRGAQGGLNSTRGGNPRPTVRWGGAPNDTQKIQIQEHVQPGAPGVYTHVHIHTHTRTRARAHTHRSPSSALVRGRGAGLTPRSQLQTAPPGPGPGALRPRDPRDAVK